MTKQIKFGILLLITGTFLSCNPKNEAKDNQGTRGDMSVDILRGDSAIFAILKMTESPCIECLQKAQADYVACLSSAGNDAAKKTACLNALNSTLATCPCPQKVSPPDVKSDGKEVTAEEAIKACKEDVDWVNGRKNKGVPITRLVWGLKQMGAAYVWYQAEPLCSYNGGMCPTSQMVKFVEGSSCTLPEGRAVTLFSITYYP